MKADERKVRDDELDLLRTQLARKEYERAQYGISPPTELVNEIDLIQKRIEAIKKILAGDETLRGEELYPGVMGWILRLSARDDEHERRIDSIAEDIAYVYNLLTPGWGVVSLLFLSVLVTFVIYSVLVIPESRALLLVSAALGWIVVILSLSLAFAFFVMAIQLWRLRVRRRLNDE